MKRLFCVTLASMLLQPVLAAQPEVFGWSCHGHDMAYLQRVIERAPEFGVNMLQLCQFFAKHGGNLPDSEQEAADLREICRLGKQYGVAVYLWVWEINGFPKERMVQGKVNLDDPATWDWMASKYRRLFDAAPELSGVILTLREVDIPVQDPREVMSKMNESQRVAKLVDTVYGVCRERGKELYVRDFSTEPGEMKNIVDAVNLMPADVGAMSKAVARDWHAFLPDNPTLDMYKGHKQIVEFDLAAEYNGQGTIPYIIAEEISRRWNNASKKDVAGAVARIDRFDARIFDSLNEANAYAYEAIVRKGANPQAAVRGYCVKRFGPDSADVMTRCLLRTYDISNTMYFTLRFKFLNDHSTVPDLKGADGHIKSASLAIWVPEEKAREEELLKPTLRTVEKVSAEKDEAIRLARLNLDELESVRSKLKPDDYQWVKGYFKTSFDLAELWKPMAVAYMMGRVCLVDPSAESVARAKRSAVEFRKAIDQFESVYGKDFSIGEVSRKSNQVVPDCRSLLAKIEARVDRPNPTAFGQDKEKPKKKDKPKGGQPERPRD